MPYAEDRTPRPEPAPPVSAGAVPRLEDPEARARALVRARLFADLLDQRFRVPGTGIRFGFDAIAGLLPGVGDTITSLIGLYPIVDAARLGVRKSVLARMALNQGIDWLVGLVPVLDVVFDVAFKANVRNLRLLERELTRAED